MEVIKAADQAVHASLLLSGAFPELLGAQDPEVARAVLARCSAALSEAAGHLGRQIMSDGGEESADGDTTKSRGSDIVGASLLDAALILTDEDRQLAGEKKSAWQKLRTPKLPGCIGNCPNHAQVKLFAPSALADFVEEVEGKQLCAKCKLRQRLATQAREPRQL
jgi:hypothetical protein